MRKARSSAVFWAIALMPLFSWGCSDSGSGTASSSGTVSGLSVAEKVSVVDTTSSDQVSGLVVGIDNIVLGSQHTTAGTDYANDETDVFVHEGSAEAFDIVNEILCMMAQTEYDAMLNKGAYKAQVDLNKCEKSGDDASSAGQSSQNQSSGSTAPDYELWVVESSRADNSSPHIVKVWVHAEGDEFEPDALIMARMTITEAKSDTNPYGIFTMNFEEHPVINGTPDTTITLFRGYLKAEKDVDSGKVLLKFAMEGGFDTNSDGNNDFSFNEKAVLNRTLDGSNGSGTTFLSDVFSTENKSAQFDIAFNSTHFRRRDANNTSDDQCFSRTRFDETVWRYGLYNADGSRKDLNAGFPIKKDDRYGWIGYYGLWFPQDVTINNGDTVYKVSYSESGEQATPYTVVKKGGKLRKHTRHSTTLSEIKGIPLDGWMEQNGQTFDNYRVKWDATAQEFKKFQKLNQTNWMWENITEAAINLSLINFGELNFWSQAIGGQVRIPLNCNGWDQQNNKPICNPPTNNTSVIYFTEDIVYPGDSVPSTLKCFDNCPKATSSGIDVNDPFNQNDFSPDFSGYDYTFNTSSSDMILKESGSADPLVLSSAGSGMYQWGVMSGPLFDPSSENLALLACDWDPNQTCGWKAWGALSVYYTWETGANNWNQLTSLTDSNGTALTFEAPLQVVYTHSQTDSSKPDYKYNGAKFFLEYSGFGNLWGIPGKCIDATGADTNCSENARWVPEFSIANGTEVNNSSNSSIKYHVKALEKEQRMQQANTSECSSLTLTSYTLPDMAAWQDPAIGDEPTITNAPAVIGGVLQ